MGPVPGIPGLLAPGPVFGNVGGAANRRLRARPAAPDPRAECGWVDAAAFAVCPEKPRAATATNAARSAAEPAVMAWVVRRRRLSAASRRLVVRR